MFHRFSNQKYLVMANVTKTERRLAYFESKMELNEGFYSADFSLSTNDEAWC